MMSPPQDCRSRGDCGAKETGNFTYDKHRLKIAAVAATAACPLFANSFAPPDRLKIAAVAATAATKCELRRNWISVPPQDCRSRGDCGLFRLLVVGTQASRLKIAAVAATAAASTSFPSSRKCCRLKIAAVAATAAIELRPASFAFNFRLKIAAVAATAALTSRRSQCRLRPPQDCRSRGDCGKSPRFPACRMRTASRLPQSRRLRLVPTPK